MKFLKLLMILELYLELSYFSSQIFIVVTYSSEVPGSATKFLFKIISLFSAHCKM